MSWRVRLKPLDSVRVRICWSPKGYWPPIDLERVKAKQEQFLVVHQRAHHELARPAESARFGQGADLLVAGWILASDRCVDVARPLHVYAARLLIVHAEPQVGIY